MKYIVFGIKLANCIHCSEAIMLSSTDFMGMQKKSTEHETGNAWKTELI